MNKTTKFRQIYNLNKQCFLKNIHILDAGQVTFVEVLVVDMTSAICPVGGVGCGDTPRKVMRV